MQNEDIPAPEEQVQTVDVVEDAEQLDTAEPVDIVVVEHQRHSWMYLLIFSIATK